MLQCYNPYVNIPRPVLSRQQLCILTCRGESACNKSNGNVATHSLCQLAPVTKSHTCKEALCVAIAAHNMMMDSFRPSKTVCMCLCMRAAAYNTIVLQLQLHLCCIAMQHHLNI